MYFMGFNIWDNISTTIFGLFMQLDIIVYWLISVVYGLFNEIASARIFGNEVTVDIIQIANVIAGVIALFLIAYTLLNKIVNPDSKDGSNGAQILKRVILSFVILVLTPFIFDFLYAFQGTIVNNNVIPELILGDAGEDEAFRSAKIRGKYVCASSFKDDAYKNQELCESNSNEGCIINFETYEDAVVGCENLGSEVLMSPETDDTAAYKSQTVGNNLSVSVLAAFVYPHGNTDLIIDTTGYLKVDEESSVLEEIHFGFCKFSTSWIGRSVVAVTSMGTGIIPNEIFCSFTQREMTYSEILNYVVETGDFSIMATTVHAVVDGEMTYLFIISTIAGGFLLWMLVSFSLDLGIRAVKLAFLQMIAPIPLFLSILPSNKDLLNNWVKKVLSAYAELFVRILIMVLAMYLISSIGQFSESITVGGLAYVIIVMGIVAFAKQLPKYFSEVTGIKGDGISLGIKDKLAAGGFFTAGAAISGGLKPGIGNLVSGIRKNDWSKGNRLKSLFKTTGSTIAGTTSGAFRAGRAGLKAGSFSDMASAASKGAAKATSRRVGRTNRNARYLSYKTAAETAKGVYDAEMAAAALMPVGTPAEIEAKKNRIDKATATYNKVKAAAFKNSRIGSAVGSLKQYMGIDSIEDIQADIEINKAIIEQKEAIEKVRDVLVNSDAMQDAVVSNLEKVAGTEIVNDNHGNFLYNGMVIGYDNGVAITREVNTSLRDMNNLINRYDREGMNGNIVSAVSFTDHTGAEIRAGVTLNDAQKGAYLASLRNTHTLLTKHIGKKTATASLGGVEEVKNLYGDIADQLTAGQKANILKAEIAGQTMVQLSNEKHKHFVRITGDENYAVTQNNWDSMDNAGNKANDNNVILQMELREAQALQQKQKDENQ